MASPITWNRRALFKARSWNAAGGALLAAMAGSSLSRTAELTVARRAMACDFSLSFPAGTGNAVDAGCFALDEVERLESVLSVYQEGSELSRLNRSAAAGPVRLSPELYSVLAHAARLSTATGGAFDAATGALVRAWGFFRGPRRVPSEPERAAALFATGTAHVRFDDARRTVAFERAGLEFNLGGIGKGFAIDRALDRMRARYGIACALMQGGQSSIRAIGAPRGERRGWKVDIGNPLRPGRALARVWLREGALGTSGGDNQYFVHAGQRYGHVLDPRTGRPARALLSASAVARTAAEADALSTAFFVLGVEGARRYCREHPGVGAVLAIPREDHDASPEVLILGEADAEAET